ncbi:hypothetical protein AAVH_22652 [Aphelenchoides avenae]|nr:hypothetical protein AAVH_22652 [Aphelenchus avenae]
MVLLNAMIKNSSWTYSVLEARVAKLEDFAGDVLTAPIIIHLTETYALKVVCLKGTVVRATGRRFVFPTEWSKNGAILSQQLDIPGLVSVAHSRDFAIASTLIAAYGLAIKALQHAVPNENFEPTGIQRQKVHTIWTKFLQFVDNTDREEVSSKLETIQEQHRRYMTRPRREHLL